MDKTRFLEKVVKDASCWLWNGSRHRQGYGRLGFMGKRSVYAHRAAWILWYGAIPDRMNVCHKCDNPQCVNPSHLFLGSQKDNMLDCARKGRFSSAKGADNNNAVLTIEQATRIKYGKEPLASLSREFGISYPTLWYVRKNITWKHL